MDLRGKRVLVMGLGESGLSMAKWLTRRGALSPSDVADAMREVRVALLEADVALPVVKEFIDKISAEAVGEKVIKSVNAVWDYAETGRLTVLG